MGLAIDRGRMNNQNDNAIIDATGVSDRWFTRNLTLAFAGIAASVIFALLMNASGRALIGFR